MAKRNKHTFHQERCVSSIRAVITDGCGNRVTLTGKHAFKWSIVREGNGKIVITTFPNRELATKEFERYK